jgi:hypothetical protein
MVSSVVPVSDEQVCFDVELVAQKGDLDKARELLETIGVPKYRARSLTVLSKYGRNPEAAIADSLQAMSAARCAGLAVVDEIYPCVNAALEKAERKDEAEGLLVQLDALKSLWELESFAEQYESFRRTMAPGAERMIQLDSLMLHLGRLTRRYDWSRADVRETWSTGEDGKRIVALGLMQCSPKLLADADILVDGIRRSHSAYEQYHALAALNACHSNECEFSDEEKELLRAAIVAEFRGDPRPDGSPAQMTGNDRMQLAKRWLQREFG